jgi:hypothetical protein
MRSLATALSTSILLLTSAAGASADPPTGNTRVVDCGDAGTFTFVLAPNAFQSSVPAFHDTGSDAVLVPLNVVVNGQFTIRSAPGVIDSAANVVSCSYDDPAGLHIEITGVLAGA